MKKRIILLLCIIMMFCTAFSLTASADSFDISRHGSITVYYTDGANGFENLEISAYRVAMVHSNGAFGLVAPFSSLPVNVNNIKSQTEWKNTANTIAAYIAADDIHPYCLYGTDEYGTVVMDNMETGLYLITAVNAERDGTEYFFENYFVVLPSADGSGWNYDIEAVPKKSEYTQPVSYRVTKLWKDAGYTDKRPDSVTVEILCDGILRETQTLSAENSWTYSWQAAENEGVWTVAEKNTPDGYSVVVSEKDGTFSIVNTYNPTDNPPDDNEDDDPSDPPDNDDEPSDTPEINDTPSEIPDTGDTFSVRRYLIVMCISGLAMLTIGVVKGRKKQ